MLMIIHWKTDMALKQRETLFSLCHIKESALKNLFPLWVYNIKVHSYKFKLKLLTRYRFKKYWLISFSHTWKRGQLSLVTNRFPADWTKHCSIPVHPCPSNQPNPKQQNSRIYLFWTCIQKELHIAIANIVLGKYLEGENIGEFGKFVAICQIFTLQMS